MKKRKQTDCLKNCLFFNVPVQKIKIKKLNNVDMLIQLPFYDELKLVQTVKAIKKYARSYSIEIMKDKDGDMNYSLAQLEASKSIIKDLFRDLLSEMKRFIGTLTDI